MGERDGTDYIFVDSAKFQQIRAQDGFLEWAQVHGNFYGTGREDVELLLARGTDVILDIDVQGAAQVREKGLGRFIFILPPSLEELERPLTAPGDGRRGAWARRLANAREELACSKEFDYLVVNDRVAEATEICARLFWLNGRQRAGITAGNHWDGQ